MALLTDRKFIHFNRKSDFEAQLNANAISDKQIVFLKDAQEIWTHGTYYGSVEQFLDETNKDSTNAVSAAAVYQALADDEEVIAAALNDLNDKYTNLDSSKQDIISDLDTIRENAQSGASKVSNVQADWNATSGLAQILHKPDLSVYENKVTSVNGQTGDVEVVIPQSLLLKGITPQGHTLADAADSYYANELNNGEAGAWFISYSNGDILVKSNDTSKDQDGRVCLSSSWKSRLNYGGMTWANVGDILLVYKQSSLIVVYKVMSINEAGETRIGLMSPNDKIQVNKISNIEGNVNNLLGKIDKRLPYSTDSTNIGNAGNGAYTNVTAGRTNWLDTSTAGAAIKLGNLQIAIDNSGRLYSRNQTNNIWNVTNQLKTITETDLNNVFEPSVIGYATVTNGPSETGNYTVYTFTSSDYDGNGFRSILQIAINRNSGNQYMRTCFKKVDGSGTDFTSTDWKLVSPSVTSVNGQTGEVTITETQLSKGTATGTGNAVTDINVSNHQITLVKGATYATQSDIDTSIANLVDSAPETLDTLSELATALGDDPNFATTVANQIGQKYTKPSTGIPASDLAAGVIPAAPGTLNTNNTTAQTVSSSEALSGAIKLHKVSKTGSYNDLIKPSGGIPKTDLASAVQTSLGKADTSVQNKGSESNIVVGVGNSSNIGITSSSIGMETENGAISIGNDITLNTSGVVNYNGSRVATVTDLQGKQDVIRDLQTIRDGAADGATAIQGVKVNGTALTPDSNKAVDITAIPASIVTEDSTHKFATNAEKTKWNTLSNVIDVPEGPDLTVTSNTIMAVGVSSPGYGMESNAIYIKAPTGSSNANILKITGNGIQTAVLNSGSLSAWTSYGTSDLTPTTPISIVQGTGSSQNIKYIKLVGNKNTDIAQIIESPDTDGGWEHAGNSGIPTVALVASKVDVKYTKPSTGIPKTDLASAVQTSLGKADSAIQGVKVNGTALTPDSNKAVNITSIPASIVTQDATHRFVTDNEKNNWDNKLDTLYNNVTSAGSTYPVSGYAVTSYVDPLIEGKQDKFQYIQEDSTSDTTSVSIESDILIVPETIYTNDNFYQIATTNDIKVTSVKVNGTALTPDANKAVNITIPEGELSTNYEPSSLDNEDLELAAGDTYEEAFGKLEKSINDNEQITAAALTDLDSRINTLHLPQSLDDIPDGSTRKLSDYATTTQLATKQDALVSGTNIKTINNESILGSGNITIQGGSGGDTNVIETIKVNGTALTPDSNKAVDISTVTSFNGNTGAITYTAPVTSVNGQTGAVNLTIPSAVTESTVSGWGFTKNAGTLTGVTIGGNPATVSNGVASFPISYKAYDDSVYSFTNWIGRLFSVLTFSDVNNFINQFIFNGTIN